MAFELNGTSHIGHPQLKTYIFQHVELRIIIINSKSLPFQSRVYPSVAPNITQLHPRPKILDLDGSDCQ